LQLGHAAARLELDHFEDARDEIGRLITGEEFVTPKLTVRESLMDTKFGNA
jgi:hypothetical protein